MLLEIDDGDVKIIRALLQDRSQHYQVKAREETFKWPSPDMGKAYQLQHLASIFARYAARLSEDSKEPAR